MSTTTYTPTSVPTDTLRAQLDQFFCGIGQGCNAYLESNARFRDIERLNAMSDIELAVMGLRRADIPRYVFRDLIQH